jgi:hypothetical protein
MGVVEHTAASYRRRRAQQSRYRVGEGRLATATLPRETQHLATPQRETHIIYSVDSIHANAIVHAQVLYV